VGTDGITLVQVNLPHQGATEIWHKCPITLWISSFRLHLETQLSSKALARVEFKQLIDCTSHEDGVRDRGLAGAGQAKGSAGHSCRHGAATRDLLFKSQLGWKLGFPQLDPGSGLGRRDNLALFHRNFALAPYWGSNLPLSAPFRRIRGAASTSRFKHCLGLYLNKELFIPPHKRISINFNWSMEQDETDGHINL
jgi:hypothetical protein